MSEENGSTSLNLREFRMQKKPPFSHSLQSDPLNSSTDSPIQVNKVARKRILPVSESSDSEAETKPETVSESQLQSSQTSNGFMNRKMKTPSIIEKERQMKFLLDIFPNMEAMTIHDVLSKHSFDTDKAAAELARCHGKEIIITYEAWKVLQAQKQQTQIIQNNIKQSSTTDIVQNIQNNFKRQNPHEQKKKRVKRRRSRSNDSDDSGGSAHDYRDIRVFDSDEDSDVEMSDELTGDKKRVFEFIQTATLNELQLMNYCSKKKAEQIIEYRPFKGWIDLVEKLQNNKSLSTDLLNAAQQVLYTRNNIKQLMRRCTHLAQQMERAIAAGAGVKTQPQSLSPSLQLTGYQMIGLNWLAVLHAQGVNGILADEMGLGKTVQVISFLAYLKETGQSRNTHLVVVPASTLDNWRVEFARWCPELRVFMYYGSQEERRVFRQDLAKGMLIDFDVILTTYTTVGNSPEERKMFRVTPMDYVIFDEAHMLKNMNTQRYENLMRINAKSRILLTGTPLQNNLLELMSLLIFVMPKMFAEKADDIKSLFQKNSKCSKQPESDELPTFEKEQIEQAKRIMKPFVLRRLKKDVLQDLPKKVDSIIEVPMAPTQKEQYEQLVASFKTASNNASENSENSSYNGMSMMTDLRKLSNHPLLVRYNYDYEQLKDIAKLLAKDPDYKDTVVEYIVEDLVWMSDFDIHTLCKQYTSISNYQLPDNLLLVSGKFLYFDKALPEMKAAGHRVLIFSQYVIMLNIIEEYMKIRKYSFLRLDGSTAVNIRQQLIDEFTEDKDIFVFLLSTRAGGLGINLTAADTVIIHDIDFNPYNDKQAEDRCHRMGQTKTVNVYRLISKGTIEEGMLQMNREKLKLEREITTDETDNPDVKSVVKLLSSVLGVDTSRVSNLVSPKKVL